MPEEQRRKEPSPQAVTSGQQPACTNACTNEPKPEQTDPLTALAAALLGLSTEERARLAAMLLEKRDGGSGTGEYLGEGDIGMASVRRPWDRASWAWPRH